MTKPPADADVLIVGAGPTGVTLGLLLARRGVRCLIVDREVNIYPLPRAAHVDHEAMRIFQELGLANAVMASSRHPSRYDFLTSRGEILLRFDGLDRIGPGGWPAGNMIHQPSIEQALRAAARDARGLDLQTGATFTAFTEHADHVETSIRDAQGECRIRSRFLVGADGARSAVRSAAGIDIDDLSFDERWLVVDVLVHDASRLPDANLQICDPARPTTCVLMGSGRHRWEFMLKPEETPEQASDDAFVHDLLAPWNVEGAISIERKAVYRFNATVARSWRRGRVLLTGDAAHLMPPFAGQGLCSGLRDAANLAWKLDAVLRGAGDRVLDTYQQERDPHVRAIIALAIMMGRTVCIADPEAARVRDASMLAARSAGSSPDGALASPPLTQGLLVLQSAGGGAYFPQPASPDDPCLRLDDVFGPGPWIVGHAVGSATSGMTAIDLGVSAAAPFRPWLEAWLSGRGAEAALIRPDRYVFGTGPAADLAAAWRAALAA